MSVMIRVFVVKDQMRSFRNSSPSRLCFLNSSHPAGDLLLNQGHDLQGGWLETANLLLQGTGSFDAAR